MPRPVMAEVRQKKADTASVADRTRSRATVGISGGAESDLYKPETGDPAADSNSTPEVDPTPILEKEMEEFEKLMHFETAASKEGGSPFPKGDRVPSEDTPADATIAAQSKMEWNQGLPCMPSESESATKEDSVDLPAIPTESSPAEDGMFHPLLDMEPPKRRSERTKRKQLLKDSDDEFSLEAKPTITIPVVGSKAKTETVLTSSRTNKMPENLMLPRSLSVSSTPIDKPSKDCKQLHSVPAARCFSVDKESSIAKDSSKDEDDLDPGIKTNGITDDALSSHPIADVRPSAEKISVAPPKKKPVVEWMVGFVRKDAQPKASSGSDLWDFDIDMARLKEIIPEMLPQNLLAQYLPQNQGQDPKASTTSPPRPKTLTQGGSVPNDTSTVVESGIGMLTRPEHCKHRDSQELEMGADMRLSEPINEVSQTTALKSAEINTQRDADQTVLSVMQNDSVEGTEIKPASDSEQHPLPSTSSTELTSPESPDPKTKSLDEATHLQDLAKIIPSGSPTENLPLETLDARTDASRSTSPTEESLKSVGERKVGDALSEDSASLDAPEFQLSVDVSSSYHQDLTDTAKERVFKPIQALAEESCTDASGAVECRSVSPKTEVPKSRRRSWRGSKGKGGIDESVAEAVPTRRSTRLRSIEMRRQSDSPKECTESTGSSGRKRRLSSRNSNGSPLEDPAEPEAIKRSASVEAVKASQEASSLDETLRNTTSETVYQGPSQEVCTSVPMDTGTECAEEVVKDVTVLREVTPQVGATSENEDSASPQVLVPTVIPSNGTASLANPLGNLNSMATSSNHDSLGDVSQILTVTNEVPVEATGIQNESSAATNLPIQITSGAKVSETTHPVEAFSVEASTSSLASPLDEAAPSACKMTASEACLSNPTSPAAAVPKTIFTAEPVTSELTTLQPLDDVPRVSAFIPAILSPEVASASSPPVATTHVLTSQSPTIPVPAEEESTHVNPSDTCLETSIQPNLSASSTAQPMEVDTKENHEADSEIQGGPDTDMQTDTVSVNCSDLLTETVAEGSEQTDRRVEKKSRHVFTIKDPVAMECTPQGNLNTYKSSRVKRPSRFAPREPMEDIRSVPNQPANYHPSLHPRFKLSFFSRTEEFTQDVWEENFTDPNRIVIRHIKENKATAEQPCVKQEPEDSVASTETKREPEDSVASAETKQEPMDSVASTETKREPEDSVASTETKREPEDSVPSMETKQKPEDSVPSTETKQEPEDSVPSTETKQEPEDSVPSTETQNPPEADIPTTTQDMKAKVEPAEDGEVIDNKSSETVGPDRNRDTWGIVTGTQVPNYENIPENYYLSERKKSKAGKEARRMVCDCTTSKSERSRGMPACGEDCLNRLLLIECTSRCPCGDYCTNRRFSKRQYADVGVFYAENKGHGLKAKADLKPHEFVMEYCGEVLNFSEFKSRVKKYNKDSQRHFYFMALRADEIIDATMKGNMSRFINHSCDPNCETQKWTVNGQIRVGFFTKKSIPAGSELTFDYQFEQYGENAQKCLCGSANCRGFIGKQKRARIATGSTPKRKESVDRKRKESFEDASLDDEIEQLCSELDGQGLRSNDETLTLARHMVLAETTPLRLQLLKILEDTTDETCLKHFLTHHGLKLLWSWMVDIGDKPELELKMEILNTLVKLPVPHKNALEDSKIFSMVERWSKVKHIAKGETEVEDSSASETPSRCVTPVSVTVASRNTPTELAKVTEALSAETDSERAPGQLAALAPKTDSASTSPVQCEKTETIGQDTELKTEVDSSTPNVEGEEAATQSPVESSVVADSSSVTQSEIVSQSNGTVDMKASEESAVVQPAGIPSPDKPKTPEEATSVPQPDSVVTDSVVTSEAKPESDTNTGTSPPVAGSPPLATTDSETVTETKDTSLVHPVNPDCLEDGELPSEAKSEDREKMEVCPKQDMGSDSDATDAGVKVEKTSGIALMAGKLLETWSSLKEIYRIPKNRDRERDRDYSERDRDRDRDRGHDRDRRYGRDRDRDRDYERDRDRDRDRDRYRERDRDGRRERSRERDRHRDRDRDRDKKRSWDRRDDRKRRSRSTSREKEEKPSSQPPEKKDADTSKGTLPKLRKPWKNEAKSEASPQGKQAKTNQSGLSKEERRQQFAKQVEQADMEEELRKQQEEEFLQQHPHFVDEEGNVIFVDANGFPIPPPYEGNPNPMMPMMHPDHPGVPMEHSMPPEGAFPHHMNPGYHDMMPPPQGMVPVDENGMPLPMHGHPMYEEVQQPDMGIPPDVHMHHPHGPNGPSIPPHVMSSDGMPMMQEHDPQGWEATPSQSHPAHPQPVLPQPQFRVPAPPGPNPNHMPVVPTPARPPSFVVPQQGQSQLQPAQPQVIQPQVVQAQPQPAAPAQTVTFVTPDGMLVTQTIMPLNTESTVQTNIQQAQQIQQHLNQGISTTQGIPSPPSKPKTQQLPPNWRTARDQEGKVYYYHAITRQTQWDMPSWDGNAPVLGGPEADMDLGTPTYDEKLKKRTTTAAADTSSELAKRCKLQFRSKMSHYVISCLNTYRKPDCKVGRITNTEDFKHLARKLTHGIMDKELKHCKNFEDLEVNSNVKHKAKEYIRKYMTHVGPVYHKDD